jgi:hypothetical protein
LKVCDLIYVITCSPFPILTLQKEAFFTAFLNDALNFGYIALLVLKDVSYTAWRKVKASWTLKSGNLVQAAHIDGAKEFTQGPM